MKFLVLKAYCRLIYFDLFLARGDFSELYERVHKHPVGRPVPIPEVAKKVCAAVDLACIWYWKEVLCLQRSAATVCLLKGSGVRALMVIGAQQMPFKTHAWVEVDGHIVNDTGSAPAGTQEASP